MALCNNLYEKKPLTFVMKIQGFEWGLGKELSIRAIANLENAVDYFARKFSKMDLA